MADTIKITEKDYLETIKTIIEAVEVEGEITGEDLIGYVDKKLAQLEKKKEKARERAAAKTAKSDEMCDAILGLLTEEPKTLATLVAELTEMGFEDVTPGKVTPRCAKAIKAGKASKQKIKGEDGRMAMAYTLPVEEDAETE